MVARDTQRFERLCQLTEESLTEFEAPDIAADFEDLPMRVGNFLSEPDIAADEEDYYQHLQNFEQSQESSKVKHVSRFFNAIRTWLDDNPMPMVAEHCRSNDVALAHPGGWLF